MKIKWGNRLGTATKQRLWSGICAILLLFGNIIPVSANETAYFVGVNDVLITMQASTLPIWVDGYMCLPYTVFDGAATGSKLGLSSSYQRSSQLVTVYDSQNTLIFDIEGETTINGNTQEVYQNRAVVRNGIPYLPMTVVCDFFRLYHSFHNTQYGSLVRIEGSQSTMTDSYFIRYYNESMDKMLQEFKQGPVVVATPALPEVDTPLCFGFTLTEEQIDFTETLENWKVKGVFFFTQAQLETRGDYLRKLYGLGHSIGFQLTGETLAQQEEELAQCQQLLFQQTRTTSQILFLTTGGESWKQRGYVQWQGTVAQEISSPQALVNPLKQGEKMVYLTLAHSENNQSQWAQLMNLLGEDLFLPQLPLEQVL